MLRKLVMVSPLSLLSAPLLAAKCSVGIQGNGQIQFSTSAVTVDKGCRRFTVNLSHPSNLPKDAIGYNWVLSTAADIQGVVTDDMASDLGKDYLKPDGNRVIVHIKLTGSGEKDSVTFDISKPKEGEQYVFFYTFPGHSVLIKGTLTLK